ncbi:hypothetical protein ABBQ32_000466 [Trebouxia sp. C0010 RCD-2024]
MLRSSTSGQPRTALVPLSVNDPCCSKTRQKLSRLLDQCYLNNKVDTKAVQKLNQLVAQYAPELHQACTTSANEFMQDMHELLQQKDGAKVAEVNEAVAEVSKKFELEAYHLRRSAAKEVADLTAQRVNLQALLNDAISRERDASLMQQLSAARQQIVVITHELQDTTALSANLKVELSAEADQRRKSEESLVRVKTELQMKTEQVLSTEQEAKCVKAELKQAEAKLLHDFKELQQQLAAEKQRSATAEKQYLQQQTELQSAFEAQQRDFAREKEAGMAAADRAASLEAQLEAAGRAACTLQSQLAAMQQDLAAEQQRHQAAHQTMATLEFQLQHAKQLADTPPAEVPSKRPQEHPQGADTPAGSLSQGLTMLLVQSRPASPVPTNGSIVEAQSVKPMSDPLVVPHAKSLTVDTLGGSATKPGSGSLIKAQALESLASPAPEEPLIAPGGPSVTPAIVDPVLTPTADADSLAPPVDGKSTMGGVASEPVANKHCTVQAGSTVQASPADPDAAAQAGPHQADVGSEEPLAHLDANAHAGPHQAGVGPEEASADPDAGAQEGPHHADVGSEEPSADPDAGAQAGPHQADVGSEQLSADADASAQAGPHQADVGSEELAHLDAGIKHALAPEVICHPKSLTVDTLGGSTPHPGSGNPNKVQEVRQLQQQLEALKLQYKKLEDEIETFDETREEEAEWLNKVEFARVEQVDKCARLEASIVQMQAAIQAADQRAAAAEVQVATAEQRAAAAEEAATAALEAAQLQAASVPQWEMDVVNQGLKDEAEQASKAAAAYQGEAELLQSQLVTSKRQVNKTNNAVLAAEAALKAAEEAKSTSESRQAATDKMCSQLLALCHTTLQAPGRGILPAASAGIPVGPPTPAVPAAPAAISGLSSHLAKAQKGEPSCHNKQAIKFEGIPGCPGYFWPSDPSRRAMYSCGSATFTIVEEWSLQNKDKLKRRARTLKSISDTPYADRVKEVWVPALGGGMQRRNMSLRQSLDMHNDRQKLLAVLPAYFEYNKSREAQIVAKILEQSVGSTPGKKFDSFIHTIGDMLSGQSAPQGKELESKQALVDRLTAEGDFKQAMIEFLSDQVLEKPKYDLERLAFKCKGVYCMRRACFIASHHQVDGPI